MRRIDRAVAAGGPVCRVGEGPLWDADAQRIHWVDIPAGALHWIDTRTGATGCRDVGEPLGFVAHAAGGGLVLGTASGIRLGDDRSPDPRPICVPPDLGPSRQINDGACDPRGRLVFGTTAPPGSRAAGTLWSLSGAAQLRALSTGVGMANGIGWSPDATTMYFVDSRAGQLAAFGYDVDGSVRNRRVIHEVPAADGLPDGLAVDVDGCIWLAVWGSGEVRRLAPDGRLLGRVEVPTPNVSSCAFGGAALDELWITTASDALKHPDPAAGRLHIANPGVRGLAVASFVTRARAGSGGGG
jgi:L-arabinonolactonase